MDLYIFFKVDRGRIQTFSKEWQIRDPNPNFPSFLKVFRQNGDLPPPVDCSDGSRGGRRRRSPPPPLKRERERGWRGVSSVPLLSIFIHMPVKCNKSLYIFTRCITLLVYLITFEFLKQSTINQKTK